MMTPAKKPEATVVEPAPEVVMDLQTALRQARTMKNFFRAFAELEGVLTAAAEAEAHAASAAAQVTDRRAALQDLGDATAAAEEDKKQAVAEQGVVRVELARLKDLALTQTTRLAAERAEVLKQVETEAAAERKRLKDETDAARGQLEKETEARRKALGAEIADLEAKKQRAEAALAGLREQMKAVF